MRCNELHCLHISVASDTHLCQHLWAAMHKRKYLMVLHQQEEETVHICTKRPTFYCIITPPEGAVKLIYFHCSVPMSACDVWRQNKFCKCVCISNGTVFSPSSLSVPDLTPNIGLFWYFFAEMFEHFRLFFLCVFQINVFFYTIPLSIKLK